MRLMQAAIHDLTSHWIRFLSFLPSFGKVVIAINMALLVQIKIVLLYSYCDKNQAIEFLREMSTLGLINLFITCVLMLKRFIFLLILLTIAFFVYRKINPE